MSRTRRGHRASRATDAKGNLLIQPVPQGQPPKQSMQRVLALDPRKPEPTIRRMMRGAKGAVKWINGLPTVHYHRDGYFWHNGRYIKGLHGTGITQIHESNRAARRASMAEVSHAPKNVPGYLKGYTPRQSDRAARKQMARAAFRKSQLNG